MNGTLPYLIYGNKFRFKSAQSIALAMSNEHLPPMRDIKMDIDKRMDAKQEKITH